MKPCNSLNDGQLHPENEDSHTPQSTTKAWATGQMGNALTMQSAAIERGRNDYENEPGHQNPGLGWFSGWHSGETASQGKKTQVGKEEIEKHATVRKSVGSPFVALKGLQREKDSSLELSNMILDLSRMEKTTKKQIEERIEERQADLNASMSEYHTESQPSINQLINHEPLPDREARLEVRNQIDIRASWPGRSTIHDQGTEFLSSDGFCEDLVDPVYFHEGQPFILKEDVLCTIESEEFLEDMGHVPSELRIKASRYLQEYQLEIATLLPNLPSAKVSRLTHLVGHDFNWQRTAEVVESTIVHASHVVLPDGLVYTGQMKDGLAHGRGVALCPSAGFRYEGEWRGGLCEGFGRLLDVEKAVVCEGQWLEGKIHGSGMKYWADGSVYTGEFKNGLMSGTGVFKDKDGNTYEGEFEASCIEGRGIYICASSKTRYEGQFKANMRHGFGVLTYANGDRYEGGWKKDKRHGQGTTCLANGKTETATWRFDKRAN